MNFLFKLSLIPSSVGGLLLLYKTYYGVPMYTGDEDLSGKVAIVTGASSGIGKEIAFQLAKRNATLIMACRNMQDCKMKRTKIFSKTNNKNIYCSELDLNSFDSVRKFVERIDKKILKIDIVVHNAAVKSGAIKKMSKDHIEQQMAVNVMSPHLLNVLLRPLLLPDARVVTLICPQYSSGRINIEDPNYDANYDGEKAFSQSQLMRTLLANYFSTTTANNIRYLTCDPGPTNSLFHQNEAYNNNFVSRNIFKYINLLILRNVWQAASTPLMCCCSPSVVNKGHYKDLACLPIDEVALDPLMMRYTASLCDKWTAKFHVNKT